MRFGEILGSSPAMQEVFRKVERLAGTDITVMVTGETGTGKELIAREIHNARPVPRGSFFSINCGAIPENLLESELFGHVRGAFTGAVANKPGRFQVANKGTLLLDEIRRDAVVLAGQNPARSCRTAPLPEWATPRPEPVDIRVIAATNRDLEADTKSGHFREDLYYRLNVVHLPLAAAARIAVMTWWCWRATCCRATRRSWPARCAGSPASAISAVKRYHWPGKHSRDGEPNQEGAGAG